MSMKNLFFFICLFSAVLLKGQIQITPTGTSSSFIQLDQLFQTSVTNFSATSATGVLVIEVLGTIVSLPLMLVSGWGIQYSAKQLAQNRNSQLALDLAGKKQIFIAIGIALIGLGIIIFATRSAMGL